MNWGVFFVTLSHRVLLTCITTTRIEKDMAKRLLFCCFVVFVFSLCSESVSKLDDFNFLKSYKLVDPQPMSKEFSYVFTKGNTYKIMLCLEEDRKKSNVEISILDRSRNVVVSNINSKGKKKNVLQFKCDTSGIYYMRYDFKDETNFCGASVLAFTR